MGQNDPLDIKEATFRFSAPSQQMQTIHFLTDFSYLELNFLCFPQVFSVDTNTSFFSASPEF